MAAQIILIVDDDELERHVLRAAFEQRGYAVEEAASAEQALPAVESRPPAALVVDLNLPGASGLALIREIRDCHPEWTMPIVLITGTRVIDLWERARAAGAQAALLKTSDLSPILESVDRLLSPARKPVPATIRLRPKS